jgi:hypothetical protein
MIRAYVQTDDLQQKSGFDAEPWFDQASDEDICLLARFSFQRCRVADEVAFHCRPLHKGVDRVIRYLERDKPVRCPGVFVGFEVEVRPPDVERYLRASRPALATRVFGEPDGDESESEEGCGAALVGG